METGGTPESPKPYQDQCRLPRSRGAEELSVFLKCRGVDSLRFVPLWLAPWLLLIMLFAYVPLVSYWATLREVFDFSCGLGVGTR